MKSILAFLLLAVSFSIASCNLGEQEKESTSYLIPDSIRGEVMVVYGYEKGESPKMKDEKRLINIPNTRILHTQTKASYGLASDEYFLISEAGDKEEIVIEVNTKSDTAICIYNIVTGKIDIDGAEYEYEAFMVCRKDSIRFYNDFTLNIY